MLYSVSKHFLFRFEDNEIVLSFSIHLIVIIGENNPT